MVEARHSGEIAQTLDRGLQVLETLAQQADGLSASEVATTLGLHRSIAVRLLTTLLRRGYVSRRRDGRYVLGLGTFVLAKRASADALVVAGPLLAEVADRLNATAVLHVADGNHAVTLASVEPKAASFHVGVRPGSRHPLTIAANGLAILAGRPPEPDELPAVKTARRRGFAVTTGELVPNFTGIAAPVLVDGWCDASVGVVIPKQRKDDKKMLAREVVELAAKLALAY